jgi:hypothetical protein
MIGVLFLLLTYMHSLLQQYYFTFFSFSFYPPIRETRKVLNIKFKVLYNVHVGLWIRNLVKKGLMYVLIIKSIVKKYDFNHIFTYSTFSYSISNEYFIYIIHIIYINYIKSSLYYGKILFMVQLIGLL